LEVLGLVPVLFEIKKGAIAKVSAPKANRDRGRGEVGEIG
jgi:hypothetical protein